MEYGKLRVFVTAERNSLPIEGAVIRITNENEPENTIEQTTTDSSGKTADIELLHLR